MSFVKHVSEPKGATCKIWTEFEARFKTIAAEYQQSNCQLNRHIFVSISNHPTMHCYIPSCDSTLSPECSSDGVCVPEASQAAQVQREAVVMGGGGD